MLAFTWLGASIALFLHWVFRGRGAGDEPQRTAQNRRLRSLFNDPLFNCVGHRMEPTARAEAIIQHLAPALDCAKGPSTVATEWERACS